MDKDFRAFPPWPAWFSPRQPEERVQWSVETQYQIQRLQAQAVGVAVSLFLIAAQVALWLLGDLAWYFVLCVGCIVIYGLAMYQTHDVEEHATRVVLRLAVGVAVPGLFFALDALQTFLSEYPWWRQAITMLVMDMVAGLGAYLLGVSWRFGHELHNPRADIGPEARARLEVATAYAQAIRKMFAPPAVAESPAVQVIVKDEKNGRVRILHEFTDEQLRTMARILLREGKQFSRRNLAGKGKPLSEAEYPAIVKSLEERGLLRSRGRGKAGWDLTPAFRAVLRHYEK